MQYIMHGDYSGNTIRSEEVHELWAKTKQPKRPHPVRVNIRSYTEYGVDGTSYDLEYDDDVPSAPLDAVTISEVEKYLGKKETIVIPEHLLDFLEEYTIVDPSSEIRKRITWS